MKVTAKNGKGPEAQQFSVDYNFGATLEESVQKFGKEKVHAMFIRAMVIALQSAMRNSVKNGVPPEKLQEHLKDWKGDPVSVKVDLKTKIATMTKDERDALLKELIEMKKRLDQQA